MKKIVVLLLIIGISIIPVNCFAMTYNEFFDTYDYEYRYMIKLSNGSTNYISCENPVTFDMSIYNSEGDTLVSGNSLVMKYTGVMYRLLSSGNVKTHTAGTTYLQDDSANKIGYNYVDVYKHNGSSFFFPITLKLSHYQRILTGLIPMIGLVISVICFRKGWVFLRNQLQH